MSANSFTVIGYQTTQQEIFLADTNMVNKHGSETHEQPNRWREMSYEYSSLSKHPPKLAKLHWRPNPPHYLRSTNGLSILFMNDVKVNDQDNIVTNHKLDLNVIFKILTNKKMFLPYFHQYVVIQNHMSSQSKEEFSGADQLRAPEFGFFH